MPVEIVAPVPPHPFQPFALDQALDVQDQSGPAFRRCCESISDVDAAQQAESHPLARLILFFGFRPAEGFRLLFQSSHAHHPVQPGVNYRSGSGSGDIGKAGIPWEEIKIIL